MRGFIRFRLNDKVVKLDEFDPTVTLLDFLREQQCLTGTKEGCNEGDCGACTVAVGSVERGALHYRPVNACIQLLGMLDGRHVVTVEHLLGREGQLHPVQRAMVEHHGSQCGFCTPGIVMSLYCLYLSETANEPSRDVVNEWLAGNLCRCTGYKPIVDAALESCFTDSPDRPAVADEIKLLDDGQSAFVGNDDCFFAAPSSMSDALELYAEHPDATPVSGATDVGLWVTKRLLDLPKILYLGRLSGFDEITVSEFGHSYISAGATYEQAFDVLARIDPDIATVVNRIGSRQVRASGTIGGNIANGSPIGDTPPILIALGAELELASAQGNRRVPLENFFQEYGRQDRRESELVAGIHVPALAANERFRATKISKRFDQDISAVMAGFKIEVESDRIVSARLAYGGMAGIPKRAENTESALVDSDLTDPVSWEPAFTALATDFEPLSDMRASAAYRMTIARNVLKRALLEIAGLETSKTRVTGRRVQSEAAE